ncbi:50S ribosomal protein L4 [Candidatus Woesearchaeota archaeon]|nr:50S ribosomal protein L4 [Candidatus Woesearchaeota archaeon]
MELKILNATNQSVGTKKLPGAFDEPVRKDLIQRAVEVVQANRRQPYGADPRAGKKAAAKLSRRRRKYKGSYGKGISRVPRKTLSRNGSQMYWVGAFAPGMVGGRRSFPPGADKDWSKSINVKERRKAIRSALAATVNKAIVQQHGHRVPDTYPFLIDTSFETLDTAKKVRDALENLNLTAELDRAGEKKVRAGTGKMRGRRYQKKVGPLLVVSGPCKLVQSARNLAGVDVVSADRLNAELLAPGAKPGRLTLYTSAAIEKLEKLFA